jgi:hypothetical protein
MICSIATRPRPPALRANPCRFPRPFEHRPMRYDEPWPLEELVRAQRMACEGLTFDDIAQALGRSSDEVRLRLEAEPSPSRQSSANVGFAHMKVRR